MIVPSNQFVHNFIQFFRSLLTRGFARFGKWFTQPLSTNPNEKKPNDPTSQLSFSFKFFVHGDSTICTSLDVRQQSAVHRLNKSHLSAAQSSQNGLKVILGPYGLSGCLTGQSFKDGDPSVSKVLSDWKSFYPMNISSKESSQTSINHHRFDSNQDTCGRSMQSVNCPPALVEVLVAGIKMKYPSCYTFVPLDCTNENVGGRSSNACKEVILSKTQLDTGVDSNVLKKVATPRLSPYCCTDPTAEFNLRYGAVQDIGSSLTQVKTITNPDNLFWEIVDTSARLTCPTSRCKSARKANVAATKSGNSKLPGKVEKPVKKLSFHKRLSSQCTLEDNDVAKPTQQLTNGQSKTSSKSPMVGGVPSNATTPGCMDSPQSAAAASEEPGSALGLSSVSPFPSVKMEVESVPPPDSIPKSQPPQEQLMSPQVEMTNSANTTRESILKRPVLQDCPEDKLESRRPASTLLYDLSAVTPSLTTWDIDPPKRRRHLAPFSSLDATSNSNSLSLKPIDPYEFSEEELGLIKSEMNGVSSDTTIASVKDLPAVPATKEVTIAAEQVQTFLVPDPLHPSMNDMLDNMFETSSGDESNDGMINCRQTTRPPIAPPTGLELSRMFPTPPSLEPAVPSPSTTFVENSLLEIPCSPAALESLKVSSSIIRFK